VWGGELENWALRVNWEPFSLEKGGELGENWERLSFGVQTGSLGDELGGYLCCLDLLM